MKKLARSMAGISSVGTLLIFTPPVVQADTTSPLPITGQGSGLQFHGNIDTWVNGQHIKWSEGDQKKAEAAYNRILERLGLSSTTKNSSNTVSPMAGLTPPPTNDVSIGTGDYLTSDFLPDSSETTSGKDSYLILENLNGKTCGPVAAHNMLTHFGPALNVTQLGPLVGFDGSGTGWSATYANGINSQESSYSYTAISTGYSPYQSAWNTAWDTQVSDTGVVGVPVVNDTYGELPEFNHALGHFWDGIGYSGNDNNGLDNPSNQYLHYFDSSEEHPGAYWFTQYPMTKFVGIVDTIGIVG